MERVRVGDRVGDRVRFRVRVRVVRRRGRGRVRGKSRVRGRGRVRTLFERRSGDRTWLDSVCDFEKVPPDQLYPSAKRDY